MPLFLVPFRSQFRHVLDVILDFVMLRSFSNCIGFYAVKLCLLFDLQSREFFFHIGKIYSSYFEFALIIKTDLPRFEFTSLLKTILQVINSHFL